MTTASPSRSRSASFVLRLAALAWLTLQLGFVELAPAAPTQDEIFRSIEQNVSTSDQSGKVLAILLCMGGLLVVIALVSQRMNRPKGAKVVNHPAKLLKEVVKTLPLRPAELKQLKSLADASAGLDTPVSSPLTLMLCPSLLAKLAQGQTGKLDRRTLAHLSKKLGNE